MKTSDFDYHLPTELIAQTPVEPRDHSRLMVLDRKTGVIEHRRFYNIVEYLNAGDVMLFNDSRVIPARLKGRRAGSGGAVEVLLLRRLELDTWEALVRPGKRLHAGGKIEISNNANDSVIHAEIIREGDGGMREIRFFNESFLLESGEIPLPPYIHASLEDAERYQTVYARTTGSVAAPTAGLHFTPGLITEIESKGISCLYTTLHIGLDTFRPVPEDDPREHIIHSEYGVLSSNVAVRLREARQNGKRIICIGTTSVRLVEQAFRKSGNREIEAFEGWVDLYILPGFTFRMTDALVTNYHLPRSTLLMMVTAFAGKDNITRAYREAIEQGYRFYSFGDAMLIK